MSTELIFMISTAGDCVHQGIHGSDTVPRLAVRGSCAFLA